MRITALTISGFRSFGPEPESIHFDGKLNCFIGLNSAGKTAALLAFQKIFGNRNDRLIYQEDFHIPHGEVPPGEQSKKLWLEAVVGFELQEPAIADFFGDMIVQEPGKPPYMRVRMEASWTPSNSLEGEIETHHSIIMVPVGAAEDPLSKRDFPKFMHQLFQVVYVPALRKTADQLRYASGSILHRLLETVSYTEEFKDNFKATTNELNQLFHSIPSFQSIQSSLQSLWSSFHKDIRYQEAAMNFGSGDLDEILRKLEVNFSPGPGHHRRFGVNDLGDGYRSLFYLSLVCTLLEIEDGMPREMEIGGKFRPLLTILAIEEPENHIAPQLLGRVINIMGEVSAKANTEVFFTSHTPAIIKRIDPESIYHFRISNEATTIVTRILLPQKEDDAYKYVKEAVQNYPEIYFAKLVIIGEGDSEELVFNHLMKVMNTDFDENIISFAPLGHRFVNHIWKLLTALKIPHITLLDLDLGRHGGGWGRIKYALKELIAIGKDPNELLNINGVQFTLNDLESMDDWDNADSEAMNIWLMALRESNVFYSDPLDLDFMMLEAYEDFYSAPTSYPANGGPRIPDITTDPEKYLAYVNGAVGATLKDEKATGELYAPEQRILMIWYKYHFLNRGKPVTHLQVLSHMDDTTIKNDLPPVFARIFSKISTILS